MNPFRYNDINPATNAIQSLVATKHEVNGVLRYFKIHPLNFMEELISQRS